MTFSIAVIVSFLIYIAIGVIVGTRISDKAGYYVAGRNAPVILITGSLIASYLSTVAFMGEAGFAYEGYPMLLLTMAAFNAAGYIVGAMFFGRYLRRSEALTVPEFFGKRFNSPMVQAAAGVTVVFGIGFYLIAVTQGVSLIISDILGVSFWAALLVFWVAFTSFTFFSGSPGVLVTDTIMFCVFTFAAVVGVSFLAVEAGGPSAIVASLAEVGSKPDMLSWSGVTGANSDFSTPVEGIFLWVVLGLVWGIIVATSPWQTSRYLMARSEHVAIRSGFVAMGSILIIYVFLALGAATVNVFNTGISPTELVYVWAAQNIFPTWLGVLIIAGVVSAGLSSASTFLSLIGFSAVNDILPAFSRRRQEGATNQAAEVGSGLLFNRLVMLGAGVFVLVVTLFSPPAVLEIGIFAATLFAASWGPLAFLSIYYRRITKWGALASLVAGFITVFVFEALRTFAGLTLPVYLEPVIPGWIVSLLALYVADLGRQPDAEGTAFRESLLYKPESKPAPAQIQRTLRYAFIAGASCVAVMILLFLVYVMPVSQVT
jgi:Na+/proline symporter